MCGLLFCCLKQRTAYEMRISDWSSDVCASDLIGRQHGPPGRKRDFVEITDDGGQSRPGNILALAADGKSRIRIRSRANKDNTRHNTLDVGRRCYPTAAQGFRTANRYGDRQRMTVFLLPPDWAEYTSQIPGITSSR